MIKSRIIRPCFNPQWTLTISGIPSIYKVVLASGALTSKYETSGRIMVGAFNSSNNKYVMASYGSITILELSYYPPPSPAR